MRIANRPSLQRQTASQLMIGDCFEQTALPERRPIVWMRTHSNDGICAVALTGSMPGAFWSDIPGETEIAKRDCELVVLP